MAAMGRDHGTRERDHAAAARQRVSWRRNRPWAPDPRGGKGLVAAAAGTVVLQRSDGLPFQDFGLAIGSGP
jgi:hypothetical protein